MMIVSILDQSYTYDVFTAQWTSHQMCYKQTSTDISVLMLANSEAVEGMTVDKDLTWIHLHCTDTK